MKDFTAKEKQRHRRGRREFQNRALPSAETEVSNHPKAVNQQVDKHPQVDSSLWVFLCRLSALFGLNRQPQALAGHPSRVRRFASEPLAGRYRAAFNVGANSSRF